MKAPELGEVIPTKVIEDISGWCTCNSPAECGLEHQTPTLPNDEETVFYLAYGSNLSSETFLGRRGIKPLSAINVFVPGFKLDFNLPGMAYFEPCMANLTALPIQDGKDEGQKEGEHSSEIANSHFITDLGSGTQKNYEIAIKKSLEKLEAITSLRKEHPEADTRYEGGLYGVVYEVTIDDFAVIIRTEGGGNSYRDVVVGCIPVGESALSEKLRKGERPKAGDKKRRAPKGFMKSMIAQFWNSNSKPQEETKPLLSPPTKEASPSPPPSITPNPTTVSSTLIHAHTLIVPPSQTRRPRFRDPITQPPQPSARYLNLIRTGAAQHALPTTYLNYLNSLTPFKRTSTRHSLGAIVVALFFFPWMMAFFQMGIHFSDKETGKYPVWLGWFGKAVVSIMWFFYDFLLRWMFGEGERAAAVVVTEAEVGEEEKETGVKAG